MDVDDSTSGLNFLNTTGIFNVTDVVISNTTGGDGVSVTGGTTQATFTNLDILTSGGSGTGMIVSNTGLTTVNGTAIIDSTGGPVLEIDPVQVDMTFTSLTSNTSGSEGILLDSLTAGSTFTVTGATNIANATDEGIKITNSTGTISFGTTTITDPGQTGIDVASTTGSFTIFSNGGGVIFTGANNERGIEIDTSTSLEVDIQGAGSGGSRFRVTGAGMGGSVLPAIEVDGADDITLSNLLVDNNDGDGININNNASTTDVDLTITNVSVAGDGTFTNMTE